MLICLSPYIENSIKSLFCKLSNFVSIISRWEPSRCGVMEADWILLLQSSNIHLPTTFHLVERGGGSQVQYSYSNKLNYDSSETLVQSLATPLSVSLFKTQFSIRFLKTSTLPLHALCNKRFDMLRILGKHAHAS